VGRHCSKTDASGSVLVLWGCGTARAIWWAGERLHLSSLVSQSVDEYVLVGDVNEVTFLWIPFPRSIRKNESQSFKCARKRPSQPDPSSSFILAAAVYSPPSKPPDQFFPKVVAQHFVWADTASSTCHCSG
jgi:hypothetical protein